MSLGNCRFVSSTTRNPRPIAVSVLDDYFDTLHTLPCFAKLAPFDVTIWTDHTEDVDVLAERLTDTEVLVLIRERTIARSRCGRR